MTKTVTTIWLDEAQTRDSQCHMSFCTIDPYLIAYRDTQKCIDYINNLKDEEDRVILIISTNHLLSSSDTLIQQCVKLAQIESIYILYSSIEVSTERFDKSSKVRGVYTERYSLCNDITFLPHVKRQRREDFQRTDFIITALDRQIYTSATTATQSPQHQPSLNTSTIDSQTDVLEFLYSKVLRDVLLEGAETAQSEMVTFCRQKYADNPIELNRVEEFEEYYKSENAIFWFTRDIFLYRLLNKALRDRDIETLYSLRYFIGDLHLRLKERYNSQLSSSPASCRKYTVYRGQLMNNAEFDEKIQRNIGGFFSMSTFLSTSRNRNLALLFAGNNRSSRISKQQCVLFEIPIDIGIDNFAYADISNDSAFGEIEKEVLFTMGTIFRIISVTEENNEDVWTVQLKLSDEEDKHLHNISSIIKQDMAEPYKPLLKLIRIMCRMQYLKEAEHFSLLALEDKSVTSDIHLLSQVYYQLAIIYKDTKKMNEAKVYFKKTLDMKYKNDVSPTDPSLANLYTNLGTVYEDMNDYNNAHTYHNLALKALSNAETVNQADLAIKYSNIGSICRKKGYYLEALQNYTNCLDIQLEVLPPDDKKLLVTKNNIGIIHIHLENYTQAIKHFQEVFQTEKNLSTNLGTDPILALTYWNLACAFYRQRQLAEAHEYLKKCENIFCSQINIVLYESSAQECKDWIQRVEDELSKEPHQIRKGYGPDPWVMSYPNNMTFTLE
jgi:tetratricopeptide (TPR) repeat protein